MKRPSKQQKEDFWYGFTIALLIAGAAAVCLAGMWIAGENTRAIGF